MDEELADRKRKVLIQDVKHFYNKYGSKNCWAGTLGQACMYLKDLVELVELQEILIQTNRVKPSSPCRP